MSGEYEVGYGKPPTHGQFQKGKSGNPKGRPKDTKNLKTDLQEELQEKIQIKEGGTGKLVSKQRAMIKAMVAKALGGDVKAASMLVTVLVKLIPDETGATDETELTQTDLQILADFEAAVLAQKQSKKGKRNGKQS